MRWLYLLILAAAASTPWAEEPAGLIVESVMSDSVAAKAGLRVGDCLLEFDGKPLRSIAVLWAVAHNARSKKEAVLRVQRGGTALAVTVPLVDLGLMVRPELPDDILALYEEAAAVRRAGKVDEAAGKLTTTAKRLVEAGRTPLAVWAYQAMGDVWQSEGKWKEAREARLAAWELVKQTDDLAMQSRALVALGLCSEALNDLQAAQRWYEQATQVDERAGYEMWVAGDLQSLGGIACTRGDFDAAQDHFTRARRVYERLAPESVALARSLGNLGEVARRRGDLDLAHQCQNQALGLFERLAPNSLDHAGSLNNLRGIAYHRGSLKEAQDYLERALAIKQELAPNSSDVAGTRCNLGLIAYERGDLVTAQERFTAALAFFERVAPGSPDVAGAFGNLGMVAHGRGDLQAALQCYARALAIRERVTPGSLEVAVSLHNLGSVAEDAGDIDAAEQYCTRALAIKERVAPNTLTVASTLATLGAIAKARGDLRPAEDLYARALAIEERLAPESLMVARTLGNLGIVATDRGDAEAARGYDLRALALFERLAPGSLEFARSHSNLGWGLFRQHRLEEALSHFVRAVETLETHRRQLATPEERALLVGQHGTAYTGLLRTYLGLGKPADAFAVLERSRARTLVEMLAERGLGLAAEAPPELLTKQEELEEKRAWAYKQLGRLDPVRDEARIEQLRLEIGGLAVAQRQFVADLRKASPRYAALQYPEPLDLKAAQAALDAGTLLLAYAVTKDETYLFAVTRSRLAVHSVAVRDADLHERVTQFRQAVMSPGGRYQALGRELYSLLVRPAQAKVAKAQRVLLCPDGPLHTLPFAALVSSSRPTVRCFAEDKPLHTIVSVSMYAELRKPSPSPRQPVTSSPLLLALGDPLYDSLSEAGKKASSEFTTRGAKLTPLPNSRREVEALGKLYGQQAVLRLGPEATEGAAKTESPNASILHFACHGLLDDKDPLGSALALTPGSDHDDGLLRAYEVMEKLRLNADLVVLSACESGLGQETKNEGIVGLTRAFQYAGARSVVVSLWNVADESTAALMTEFYRQLEAGKPKDEALRAAQLSFLHPNPQSPIRNRKSFSHPYYWAPFVLVGDWRRRR